MSTPAGWQMSGTTLARLRSRHPGLSIPEGRFAGPPALSNAALEQLSEPRALQQLAWELARLVTGDDTAREALYVLAFAMLDLAHRGSTTVPRTAPGLREVERLRDLLEPSPEAAALLTRLAAGEAIPPALQPFVAASGDVPILRTDAAFTLHRFERMEARLAGALADLVGQPALELPPGAFTQAVQTVRASTKDAWTNEQQIALFNAVHLPFSVVSGGPGTGKTSIVVSLLRLLARLGLDPGRIALAAPTGKAANRMYEVVRQQLADQEDPKDAELLARLPEPRTLHRLLGYSPASDRFRYDEQNPLEQDLVIVDECSMVDVFLMDQLLRACTPRGHGARPRRLVLLGDGHQLPSVEAGMVLQHLTTGDDDRPVGVWRRPWHDAVVPQKGDPTVPYVDVPADVRSRFLTTLTRSYRMNPENESGRAVYLCALALKAGGVERLKTEAGVRPVLRASASELAFDKVEALAVQDPKQPPQAFFERWWSARIDTPVVRPGTGAEQPVAALWGHIFRFGAAALHPDDAAPLEALLQTAETQRILCLTKGADPIGAETANDWFGKRRSRLAATSAGLAHRSSRGIYAGEPVLFLENDYGLRLFNGDHGVLAWTRRTTDSQPVLRAVFPRAHGPEAFDLESVQARLQRAYALTVHKAQGSQVTYAAVLLPARSDSPLLVNQLLYTAVSRASHSVVVVGDLERLYEAARNPVRRFSGVVGKVSGLVSGRGLP